MNKMSLTFVSFTKGIQHRSGISRHDARGFGIDMWHTVEFSRFGRAPHLHPFGPDLGQPF